MAPAAAVGITSSEDEEAWMESPSGRTVATRAMVALAITAGAAALGVVYLGRGAYDWVKALHVVAIISWMAGMLYLPRLFIYHCDAETGSKQSETFKVMESRLLRVIINPAMVISWVTGIWLAWASGFWQAGWFHGKFAAVLMLSAAHGYLSAATRAFAEDRNQKPPRHWRIVNEVPTVLMLVIVVLVIVKPF
jgi:putative membrane protein